MFNSIRRLTNNARPTTGKTITSIEGQIQTWKEYLEEILNTSTSFLGKEETARLPPPPPPPELPISIRPPAKREIVDVIKTMKNGIFCRYSATTV
jgi:hypothetical protein